MITHKETNTLFLSDRLEMEHPSFYYRFMEILKKQDITPIILKETKEIWAWDYMPVQVSANKFVLFHYHPNYPEWFEYPRDEKLLTDAGELWPALQFNPDVELAVRKDIQLEGGGIARGKHHAVITNKAIDDNREVWSEKDLLSELSKILDAEIIVIPKDKDDITGHADGMVRFIDDHTAVVNEDERNKNSGIPEWASRLTRKGINCIPFPYDVYDNTSVDDAAGIYINYLQIGNKFFVPTFSKEQEKDSLAYIREVLGGEVIEVPSGDLSQEGGILNCIAWNIMS